MAINKTVTKRSLVLVMSDGVDGKGEAKSKHISFPDVKIDAQPEQIMATASAFSTLYEEEMLNVFVHEQAALTQQA